MIDYPDLPAHEYSRKIDLLFLIYEKMIKALQKEEGELEKALKDVARKIQSHGQDCIDS